MNSRNRIKLRRGDSIIEVLLAVAIFSAIAVTSIAIMNKGLATAESSLETTIVRTEFDAQAEAIRFIKQSYESNAGELFGTGSSYQTIWNSITQNALEPNTADDKSDYNKFKSAISPDNTTCPTNTDLSNYHPFVINVANKTVSTTITTTSSIPSAESGGLWVVAVRDGSESDRKKINYYDFYISACWDDLSSSMPAWRTTIIRLMNPDHEAVTSTPTTISRSVYVTLKAGNDPTDNTPFTSVDFVRENNGSILESASEYEYAACNASWDSSEKPKTNQECTLERGDINVVAKTNGFTFNGWDYEKITFKYDCTDGSCTIQSGTIKAYKNNIESSISGTTAALTAQWTENKKKFALFISPSSGISPLTYVSNSDSEYPFTLPSVSVPNHVLMGWTVDSTTYSENATITVKNTDICTVTGYDYCKTATAIFAELQQRPSLAYGNVFSVTMTFPCAQTDGIYIPFVGRKSTGLCATIDNNRRKYDIQLIDESDKKNKVSGTIESYESFSKNDTIASHYIESGGDTTYELEFIRQKKTFNASDSRRIEILININQMVENQWYTINLHSNSTGKRNFGDIVGLINGINVEIGCYVDEDDKNTSAACTNQGATGSTSGITGDDRQNYPIYRIRRVGSDLQIITAN